MNWKFWQRAPTEVQAEAPSEAPSEAPTETPSELPPPEVRHNVVTYEHAESCAQCNAVVVNEEYRIDDTYTTSLRQKCGAILNPAVARVVRDVIPAHIFKQNPAELFARLQ